MKHLGPMSQREWLQFIIKMVPGETCGQSCGGWVAVHIWRGTLTCWILWSIKGTLARSCMTSQRRRTLPCVSDCKEPLERLWSYGSSVHFNSHTPTRVDLGNGNWEEFHVLEREIKREKKTMKKHRPLLFIHTRKKYLSSHFYLLPLFLPLILLSFLRASLKQKEA